MSDRLPNISYQEVAAAIETLVVEGTTITNKNVRRVLARNYPHSEYRGSPNKVQDLMNQYFANNSYELLFRESHLSTELTGALVAEIKKHMATFQEQNRHRLEGAEKDREQFLLELTRMTEERDDLLERINVMESAHASEIKSHEVEEGKLQERASRWEDECRQAKKGLEDAKELLEKKVGELAVAREQAKPANDLKDRLDTAERKNSDYFKEIQELNQELRKMLKEKAELEKRLLQVEKQKKA